jgi:hypothetical protein
MKLEWEGGLIEFADDGIPKRRYSKFKDDFSRLGKITNEKKGFRKC